LVHETLGTVSTLLTSTSDPINCPPCIGKAAFAEHLHVYATATDGWYTLNAYDAPRPRPDRTRRQGVCPEPA
jgi:hypothetical protein